MKYLEDHTQHSAATFAFAAGAFPPENAPFFPVSSTQGSGHGLAIGLESAGTVAAAFSGPNTDLSTAGNRLTAALGAEAKRVEEIALRLEKQTGWKYQGIDLTPVPLKDVSIGAALQVLLLCTIGSPSTLPQSLTITSAVRRVSVRPTGYS